MTMFAPDELALLADTDFFRRRVAADAAVLALLRRLRDDLRARTMPLAQHLPPAVDVQTGKISRGEHYRLAAGFDVPYRVLDYPRLFRGNDWCTYRCLLLWGTNWSAHLLLTLPALRQRLAGQQAELAAQGWWVCTGQDPWRWEPADAQLQAVAAMAPAAWQRLALQHPFLRLSRTWPIAEVDRFTAEAVTAWQDLLVCLAKA